MLRHVHPPEWWSSRQLATSGRIVSVWRTCSSAFGLGLHWARMPMHQAQVSVPIAIWINTNGLYAKTRPERSILDFLLIPSFRLLRAFPTSGDISILQGVDATSGETSDSETQDFHVRTPPHPTPPSLRLPPPLPPPPTPGVPLLLCHSPFFSPYTGISFCAPPPRPSVRHSSFPSPSLSLLLPPFLLLSRLVSTPSTFPESTLARRVCGYSGIGKR